MTQGMLQDILTPSLSLNEHSHASWNYEREYVEISWFGKEINASPSHKLLSLSDEEEIRHKIVSSICEKIPLSPQEIRSLPSYYYWDFFHKKECLAIERYNDVNLHACAPGKLPSPDELPHLRTIDVSSYESSQVGSLTKIHSDKHVPAAILSTTEEALLSLLPHGTATITHYGLLMPTALYLGDQFSICRYYETNLTGDAIMLSDVEMKEIINKPGGLK